jgi:hypothetical protein
MDWVGPAPHFAANLFRKFWEGIKFQFLQRYLRRQHLPPLLGVKRLAIGNASGNTKKLLPPLMCEPT